MLHVRIVCLCDKHVKIWRAALLAVLLANALQCVRTFAYSHFRVLVFCCLCVFCGQKQEETAGNRKTHYTFFAGFKSHESEFDYLKSLEIEEKINQIKWCPPINNAQFLLSTNGACVLASPSRDSCVQFGQHSPTCVVGATTADKTIKLWKIREKKVREMAVMEHPSNGDTIPIPRLPAASRSVVATTERRVFANAHAYHINSISLNSDGETFLSADDLRLNWWNLEINDRSFNIVDMKPTNMEELTEVITSAQFHPQHCHVLMYSTSRGTIKLGDTRQAALCDHSAKSKFTAPLLLPRAAKERPGFSRVICVPFDVSQLWRTPHQPDRAIFLPRSLLRYRMSSSLRTAGTSSPAIT